MLAMLFSRKGVCNCVYICEYHTIAGMRSYISMGRLGRIFVDGASWQLPAVAPRILCVEALRQYYQTNASSTVLVCARVTPRIQTSYVAPFLLFLLLMYHGRAC